jgi:hypothetical protein
MVQRNLESIPLVSKWVVVSILTRCDVGCLNSKTNFRSCLLILRVFRVNMTNTEYYFRYLGSLVEPPCFVGVHWRVLRLPVKISPRQLYWLGKLLKLRLNPTTCENDMVGRPVPTKARVEVNRPQQVTYGIHDVVYCECINWNSTR